MSTRHVGEAFSDLRFPVFKLGVLSGRNDLCNRTLLGKAARIALHATGADSVTLAMFESLEDPALVSCTACIDPGELERSSAIHERTNTIGRPIRIGTGVKPMTELLGEGPRDEMTVLPGPTGDKQLVGGYDSGDERTLVILVAGIEDDRTERLARELAPAIVECCRNGWKKEPGWLRELRPASRQVLELVLQGYDDDQVAEISGLTYHSVRAHLKRLFRAAGVRSRLHLMQVCRTVPAAPREFAAAS